MTTKLPKWARIRKLIDGRFIAEIKTGVWPFRSWKGIHSNSNYTWSRSMLKHCIVRTEAEAEAALASWGVDTTETKHTEPLAFITGSYAYGAPSPDSDVDLVVLCDQATHDKLIELSDNKCIPVRYGKLNIFAMTSKEEYTAWAVAKDILCGKLGSTKKERIEIHKQCLAAAGIAPRRLSGD